MYRSPRGAQPDPPVFPGGGAPHLPRPGAAPLPSRVRDETASGRRRPSSSSSRRRRPSSSSSRCHWPSSSSSAAPSSSLPRLPVGCNTPAPSEVSIYSHPSSSVVSTSSSSSAPVSCPPPLLCCLGFLLLSPHS